MDNKKLVIGIITIFFIGVTGLVYSLGADNELSEEVVILKDAGIGENKEVIDTGEPQGADKKEDSGNTESMDTVFVHLCGEVKNPQVYEIGAGSRIIDVVQQAGGFTKQAAKDAVNLAQKVEDGQKIYIPSKQEIKEGSSSLPEQKGEEQDSLVNINTATKEELMTLTGIGEAKANSIIAYRETNGSFQKIEDLKKIEGIKDGVFEKVRSLIKIG